MSQVACSGRRRCSHVRRWLACQQSPAAVLVMHTRGVHLGTICTPELHFMHACMHAWAQKVIHVGGRFTLLRAADRKQPTSGGAAPGRTPVASCSFATAWRPSSSLRAATTVLTPDSARMRATSQPMPLLAGAGRTTVTSKATSHETGEATTQACRTQTAALKQRDSTSSHHCSFLACSRHSRCTEARAPLASPKNEVPVCNAAVPRLKQLKACPQLVRKRCKRLHSTSRTQ
jgi:hypothetical protein